MSFNKYDAETDTLEQLAGNATSSIDDANVASDTTWSSEKISVNLGEKVPFKFGVTDDGKYGYYKAGADSVTPFKSVISDILDPTAPIEDIIAMISDEYPIVKEVPQVVGSETISTSLQSDGYLLLGSFSAGTGLVDNRTSVKSNSGCTLTKLCGFDEHLLNGRYEAWALYLITNATGTVSVTSGGDQYSSSRKIIFKK